MRQIRHRGRRSAVRAAAAWLTVLVATACLVALPGPPASAWTASSVGGKVVFNNGAPAAGATVTLTRPFDVPRSTTTDAAGNYHIGNLGPDDYSIAVRSPDGCARGVSFPIEGRTLQHTADIRLPPVLDGYGHYCRATPSPYLEAATQWDLGENGSATVGMPFAFPFYGQSYATAHISANGFVSFLPLAGSSDNNVWLEHSSAPKAAVLPFWDDLRLEGTTGVYTGVSGFAPNRRFTIEWRDIILAADAAGGRRIDVEVALYENGAIEFHYRNIDPTNAHENGSFATVGLTNAAGTDNFTYKYNTSSFPVADNRPFRFELAPQCNGVPATVWGGLPLNGLPLGDVIVGTEGPETINGGGGDDLICAGGGDDQVHGDSDSASPATAGNDTIFAGDGNDAVDGDQGTDVIEGGGGHDTILGSSFGGTLLGGAGNDTLTGREWHDSVDGGEGDDILVQTSYWADGTDGADVLDGGPGADEVRYSTRTGPVTVDLSNTAADDGAPGEGDQLLGVENVQGGSAGDTLIGSDVANRLQGNAGDDTVVGGAGNDVLLDGRGTDGVDGGTGNDTLIQATIVDADDTLDGGPDSDEVRYSARRSPVTVDLGIATGGATTENDQLLSIENARGGSAADTLTGTGGTNRLFGLAGEDTIDGSAGADTISGGDGDDTLYDGADADRVDGGPGDDVLAQDAAVDPGDVLDGGADTDEIRYSARTTPVTVDLTEAVAEDGATGENDQLLGLENAQGGTAGDTLVGSDTANRLAGGAGNDTIVGGDGADSLVDGAGADDVDGGGGNDVLFQSAAIDPGDVLDGGADIDEVRYTARSLPVTLNLAGTIADDGAAGENDRLLGIENARGGTAGDTIVGGGGNSTLYGNGGDDTIAGGGGADRIFDGPGADQVDGGIGNDVLSQDVGADANDVLNGGTGIDEVRYTLRAAPVTINLLGTTADDGAVGESDQLLGIENAHGGSGSDSLTGDGGGNRLFGYDGDDSIVGGDGADSLHDGPGADSADGGAGNDVHHQGATADPGDVLDGGAGADEIRYTARTTPVTISLSDGAADDGAADENDQLLGIEHAQGGAAGDAITGTTGANRLQGHAGDDTVDGLEGNDTLTDGPGADFVGGGAGNDVLVQGATADNGDRLDGGAGIDEVRYSARTTPVVLTLFNIVSDDGAPGEGDGVVGVENARGGSAGDHLAGSESPNRLVGGAGPDFVTAFGGDDTVDVADGLGHDHADGGPGTDTVTADPGDLTISFNP